MPNGHRYAGSEGPAADTAEAWSSPGKRTLTDSIQRKAAETTSHPLAAPTPSVAQPESNGLSCDQSFLDSILEGPVQRKADGEQEEGSDVHALAAEGVAGAGGSLPFLDRIQASFGRHDVSGVQAHTDGAAAAAAEGMGASAFAAGNHVGFGDAPDLHTAAHEAAHVVQQRDGVTVPGGVGAEGDSYEQHADAVADQVVRGESAEALLDQAGGGGSIEAVQLERKPQPTKPSQADRKNAEAESDKLMKADAEDHFLDTISYYLQWQHFRTGGRGPASPRQQKEPLYHSLAEQVRGAILIHIHPTMPGRSRKAIDAWGAARLGVMKVLDHANQRGSAKVAKAADGVGTADAYIAGRVVDEAVAEAANGVDIVTPDAGFMAETQKAVDQATLDTMELIHAIPQSAQGELKAKLKAVPGMPFDEWYALVTSTQNADERLKKAKAKGFVVNEGTVADMLRGALYAVKGAVTAINTFASLMPAAQGEAAGLFARFAKVTGDATITTFGEVLTKALGVIQIIAGAIGLVKGIMSGNVKEALKGAQRIAAGGVSLGMLGVGAGFFSSLTAAGLVFIFFGTLDAILDVGALLRDMKRQETLQAAYDFIQDAGKIVPEAREFVASVEVMFAGDRHSSDATMQNEVEERVEKQAMELGAKVGRRLQALGQSLWTDNKKSVGGHPDLIAAMGSQTRRALGDLAMGINNEPLMVADKALYIFQGIEAMGRYAMQNYGKPI